MCKSLPFQIPAITSYQGIANLLGILKCYPGTEGWIYNNYIQLIYYENLSDDSLHDMSGSFFDLETGIRLVGHYAYCPFLNLSQIDRSFLEKRSIVNFTKKMIDQKRYTILWLNQFVLPQSEYYQKSDIDNPVMVYGYDDREKNFMVSGFFTDGKYGLEKIKYDDYEIAFSKCCDPNDYTKIILLVQFQQAKVNFDLSEFLEFLKDYLDEKDHTSRFYYIKDKLYFYGLKYYDKVIEQYYQGKYDMRLLHILYDHKIMMNYRLKYLLDSSYLSKNEYENLKELNDKLINKCKLYRNLLIKNRIVYHYKEWDKEKQMILLDNIKKLKDQDKAFMLLLYNSLSNSY